MDFEMGTQNLDSPSAPIILVVDDNAENRDVLSKRLHRHGYQVMLAADGPSALQLIAEMKCDLVLLDVMMPGMNGLEVLQKIRETQLPTKLPVIMATARGQSEDVVEALKLGANDYVIKPLDFVVLLARVQTQLMLKKSVEEVLALQLRLSEKNQELEAANGRLTVTNDRICRDLRAAARVQEAFLPNSYRRTPSLDFAWVFEPCEQLAGDFLNICPLDEDHVAFYVLDVSGHGVAASLLAMAAARALSSAQDPDSLLMRPSADTGRLEPTPPAQVAERLNQKFAWDANTEQFLTIFYAVINAKSRVLTYTSAGHPGAILVSPREPAVILDKGGLPISLGSDYKEYSVVLKPSERLYLYSDGVTEAMNSVRELFGQERLINSLEKLANVPLPASISRIMQEIHLWRGGATIGDDVSLLALECLPK
jgi:sigma-B regulation protein RsbU (phosphoserine phosphatase)